MQFAAPSEQQTVTTPTQTPSNVKTTNGSGKVLHRVIALTAAGHGDGGKPRTSPPHIPEKLRFSAFEKFEGKLFKSFGRQHHA